MDDDDDARKKTRDDELADRRRSINKSQVESTHEQQEWGKRNRIPGLFCFFFPAFVLFILVIEKKKKEFSLCARFLVPKLRKRA